MIHPPHCPEYLNTLTNTLRMISQTHQSANLAASTSHAPRTTITPLTFPFGIPTTCG